MRRFVWVHEIAKIEKQANKKGERIKFITKNINKQQYVYVYVCAVGSHSTELTIEIDFE
jgi:fructoselysine-6-P-deglycase FrlB-like protein